MESTEIKNVALADLLSRACWRALHAARRMGRTEEDASWCGWDAEGKSGVSDNPAVYAAAYSIAFSERDAYWTAFTTSYAVHRAAEWIRIAAREIDRQRMVTLYLVEPPERQAACAAMDQVSPALWALSRVVVDAERRFAVLRASVPPTGSDDDAMWRAVHGQAGEIVAAVAGVEAHIEKNRVAGFAEAAP